MATTKITSPDLFNLESLNTALQLPSGTTAERPASPSTGEWRYNTTTNLIEFYDGGAWRDLQSEDIPPIPSENFNVVLYTGNGGTQSITGVGFQPDFVWLKNRSLGGYAPRIFDSSRGATNRLQTSTTAANATEATSLTSFDADGFSLGSDNYVNNNGSEFVAWCWKLKGGTTTSNADGSITSTVQVNTRAGFSVVQYTADGTNNTTIGHGLGAAPDMIIIKKLTATGDWITYHQGVGTGNFLYLNRDDAQLTQAGIWSNINSTTFNLISGYNDYNQSGQDYVAYCFAPKTGYSKINSYTGNGSSSGPIVNTGFEPAFVMIKRIDAIDDWIVVDNKRNTTNSRYNYLMPNSSAAENGSATGAVNPLVNFLTNGFQIAATWGAVNNNGSTYIYMAFASDPSTAPVLADSFNTTLYTGNASTNAITGLGFSPSFIWLKERSGTDRNVLIDIIRGEDSQLSSNSNADETTFGSNLDSFDADGFTLGSATETNGNGETYVSWNWKANPLPTINTDGDIQSLVSVNQAAGMSVVKYTGTGSNATVGHGLSSSPDMVIIKRIDGGAGFNWIVGHSSLDYTANQTLTLDSSTTVATWNYFNATAPTSSVFYLGTGANTSSVNGNGGNYIAYCFNSVSGYSSFGSYTGVSSGVTITTGFRPSFMFIKSSSNVENWAILDTARGTRNALNPNLTNAESESTLNTFTVTDTGFSFPDQNIADAMLNENGYEYIYWAMKANPTHGGVSAGKMAYLVVAGGGSGGWNSSTWDGAGGGGGVITSYGDESGGSSPVEPSLTLASGTYTITIGAGGFSNSGAVSVNGNNSTITGNATITAIGGGGGGDVTTSPLGTGRDGGSGGGGSNYSGNPAGGNGTGGQGYYGGQGSSSNGGGGGGASKPGLSDGTGGDGLYCSITGTATYYAGGAAGFNGTGTAGQGGGGTPASAPGGVNTGGGGAGTRSATSADGGSGIVILRLKTSEYSGTVTGSPTVTTDGDETILKYTGSGTYVHS